MSPILILCMLLMSMVPSNLTKSVCEPSFQLLQTTGCLCSEGSITFECTVPGEGSTVFRGSAFNCDSSNNEIILLHSRYNETNGAYGTCNEGDIVGHGVSVDGICRQSILSISSRAYFIGKAVQCIHDNGTTTIPIGNHSILPPSISIVASPPSHIFWEVLSSGLDIRFRWEISATTNCSDISYNTFAVGCGNCSSFTINSSVLCTNASPGVCTFAVQTVICGDISGDWSDAVQIQLGFGYNRATSGFSQISTVCECPRHVLTYQCIVPGGTATVWKGSAFECNNDDLVLLHEQFQSISTCNNTIFGEVVYKENGNYISILNVSIDFVFLNKTIECAYSSGSTLIPLGRTVIDVTGITGSYSSPHDVHVTDLSFAYVTFNWSSVALSCPHVQYKLYSLNCGTCPLVTTHTTVSCINPVIDGSVCRFNLLSVYCGDMAETTSNVIYLTLKLPEVQQINVIPHYAGRVNDLQNAEVLIMMSVSFSPETNYLPSKFHNTTMYTLYYSDTSAEGGCSDSDTIHNSLCNEGICRHDFQVSSSCLPSNDITMSVFATNILGTGPHLTQLITGSVVRFVNITIKRDLSAFICDFINQTESVLKHCHIRYGPGRDCDIFLQTTAKNTTGNKLDLTVSISSQEDLTYCFTATASNGTYTVVLQRVFQIACDPLLLGDNSSILENLTCDSPYKSIGILNGIACYSANIIGSTAVYYCFECGFATIKGFSTRTCSSNGSWTGIIPQCSCNSLSSYPIEENESETWNFTLSTTATITVATSTNTSNTIKYDVTVDDNVDISNNTNFPRQITLIVGILITSGALLFCIIVVFILTCLFILCFLSKRKLQRELFELQETINPIYEDIDFNTKRNIAYST